MSSRCSHVFCCFFFLVLILCFVSFCAAVSCCCGTTWCYYEATLFLAGSTSVRHCTVISYCAVLPLLVYILLSKRHGSAGLLTRAGSGIYLQPCPHTTSGGGGAT